MVDVGVGAAARSDGLVSASCAEVQEGFEGGDAGGDDADVELEAGVVSLGLGEGGGTRWWEWC